MKTLGRTNQNYPPLWLGLNLGYQNHEALVGAIQAFAPDLPLDVTSAPSLWGHHLRGSAAAILVKGTSEFERSPDSAHSREAVSGHLIQTLSSIGRSHLDFYFLPVSRVVEEHQIAGALEALELAKQDGLVRHIGLYAAGPSLAVQGVWRYHDAFEVMLARRNPIFEEDFQSLAALAGERRVGVVSCSPFRWASQRLAFDAIGMSQAQGFGYVKGLQTEHPVLVGVETPGQVEGIVKGLTASQIVYPALDWSAKFREAILA